MNAVCEEIQEIDEIITHPEYNIKSTKTKYGNDVEFRDTDGSLLGYMDYSITSETDTHIIIYVKDTMSAYKYRENCSQSAIKLLEEKGVSQAGIAGFGKIMIEIILRSFRETYPQKTIDVNFVSLDADKNRHALRNAVFAVSHTCGDICTSAGGGNGENYTATIQLGNKI
ncbi:hypothetical protein LAT59_05120 [Candidatus Gracilibacteria bacterium]|nr:hypothetical protein [Candidatus Gracilibacteria bacterium]